MYTVYMYNVYVQCIQCICTVYMYSVLCTVYTVYSKPVHQKGASVLYRFPKSSIIKIFFYYCNLQKEAYIQYVVYMTNTTILSSLH